MKRTYSKLAAQPEHDKDRRKPAPPTVMTTADRVRASLLQAPPRSG